MYPDVVTNCHARSFDVGGLCDASLCSREQNPPLKMYHDPSVPNAPLVLPLTPAIQSISCEHI